MYKKGDKNNNTPGNLFDFVVLSFMVGDVNRTKKRN